MDCWEVIPFHVDWPIAVLALKCLRCSRGYVLPVLNCLDKKY